MYQESVIPDMNPGSRLFNKSIYSYGKLDSRFTVRTAGCPGMTRKCFAYSRHSETLRAAVSGPGKTGFTLIELLVVVLIVGILSAVALPQYKKVIIRMDVMQVKVLMEQIKKAQLVYKSANGVYTTDLSALDLEFPTVIPEGNGDFYDINSKRLGLTRIKLMSNGISFTNWGIGYDGVLRYEGITTCANFLGSDYIYADYACRMFKEES